MSMRKRSDQPDRFGSFTPAAGGASGGASGGEGGGRSRRRGVGPPTSSSPMALVLVGMVLGGLFLLSMYAARVVFYPEDSDPCNKLEVELGEMRARADVLLQNLYDAEQRQDQAQKKLAEVLAEEESIRLEAAHLSSEVDQLKTHETDAKFSVEAARVEMQRAKDAQKKAAAAAAVVGGDDSVAAKHIKGLQALELARLRARYGEGPALLRMHTSKGLLLVETAPFADMPHTVAYFLGLAEQGYWDGCSFLRNAPHVLQANCLRASGNPLHQRTGRASVAFQEYSSKWQHEPYTLGLAGRPGGDDFYVNLKDNKVSHGPGGQGPEPDPCFARLIDGFDVINEMHDHLPPDWLLDDVQVVIEKVEVESISQPAAAAGDE